MALLEGARARLQNTLETLRKFRLAVLDAACSGALTEDWRLKHGSSQDRDAWVSTTVGSETVLVQYGYTESAILRSEGPRFLRITDIQDEGVDWTTVPSCNIGPEDESKYALRAGDIVFARSGATTGKSFLVQECPRAVFASYLIRVRPGPCVSPEFLYLFFRSPQYWRQLNDNLAGNAQPNCNASKLKTLEFALPPRGEQNEILRQVENLLSIADVVEERTVATNKIIDRVSEAILTAGFTGRLVPLDSDLAQSDGREYEPAAVLLQRIAEARCGKTNRVQRRSGPARARGTRAGGL